ncbi:hypothetical protein F5146DRAFT_1062938 [Armillaria mellea]|nr:hypothetical protein F5146DRAFT_1062938 [Armillaria mellea]
MTDYVCLDPFQEATHWFLLDIASGREKGVALLGPPPKTVFAKPQHDQVVAAIVDCVEWHCQHESGSANVIMNACRAWRFTETKEWGSKAEGVEWATKNLEPDVPEVLHRVILARRGRTSLQQGVCNQFLELVLSRILAVGS